MKYLVIRSTDMWPIRLGHKKALLQFHEPDIDIGTEMELYLYDPLKKRSCTFCWGTGELDEDICPWCGGGDCRRYPSKVAVAKVVALYSTGDITAELAKKAHHHSPVDIQERMEEAGAEILWVMEITCDKEGSYGPINKGAEDLECLEPV